MGKKPSAGNRVIVSDTGPLLHLSQIGLVGLLRGLGRVLIPPEVQEEWARLQQGIALAIEVEVVSVAESKRVEVVSWIAAGYLDPGEAYALALAQQVQADWYLTDDAAARVFAQSLGIEVHGSLGVILAAAVFELITPADARMAIQRLAQESTLWVSARVVQTAYQALEELFPVS